MRMTEVKNVDDAIAYVDVIASGRTRYEGQNPFIDELLIAEIRQLRARIAAAHETMRAAPDYATMDKTGSKDKLHEAGNLINQIWFDLIYEPPSQH